MGYYRNRKQKFEWELMSNCIEVEVDTEAFKVSTTWYDLTWYGTYVDIRRRCAAVSYKRRRHIHHIDDCWQTVDKDIDRLSRDSRYSSLPFHLLHSHTLNTYTHK